MTDTAARLKRRCDDCEWWVNLGGVWGKDRERFGDCRATYPVVGVDLFPRTKDDDWCSHFQLSEDKDKEMPF